MEELLAKLNAWLHRKESEKFTTDSNGSTAVNIAGTVNIAGYEKFLSLLSNANWLQLVNYEEVQTSFSGNVATLNYLEGGDVIAKLIFTYVSDTDWGYKLESYINDDNGDILLDDDDTPLFLD